MDFGSKLKKMRTEKGISQNELAKKVGVSRSSIANYETNRNFPTTDILLKIAREFNCTIEFLVANDKTQTEKNNAQYYMCPVYEVSTIGQTNWDTNTIQGRIPIDYKLMNIAKPEECFFLRMPDESMNYLIKKGAFALIHKQASIKSGETALVLVKGHATLRKYTKQKDSILLEPQCSNAKLKPEIYPTDLPIKIIGKYMGKIEINNT